MNTHTHTHRKDTRTPIQIHTHTDVRTETVRPVNAWFKMCKANQEHQASIIQLYNHATKVCYQKESYIAT